MTANSSKTSLTCKSATASKPTRGQIYLANLAQHVLDRADAAGRLLGAVSMRLGTRGIGASAGTPHVQFMLPDGTTIAVDGRRMKPRRDRTSFSARNLTPSIEIV